jgi:hypothetical protein
MVARPVIDPAVAVMVVVPADRALASPELFAVATDAAEEDQLTELVPSFVLPSL